MRSRCPRTPKPLNEQALHELALSYVGRYATTRAKLRDYLARKLRERPWNGTNQPDSDALVNRFVASGLIDDADFALVKARALAARGYGERRLRQSLRAAGISEEDGAAARAHSRSGAVASALKFAERRRLGPFAAAAGDRAQREKAIATMVRAGHAFALARAIANLPPGATLDFDLLVGRDSGWSD